MASFKLSTKFFNKFINKFSKFSNFSNPSIRRFYKLFDNLNYKEEQIINYFKWTDGHTINLLLKEADKLDINNDNEMKNFLNLTNNKLSMLEKMLLIEKNF